MDRPRMGRGRHARRACGQSNTKRATRERRAEKEKKDVFLFLEERSEGSCSVFWVVAAGAQLLRPQGVGTAAKNGARTAARGGNPACRALRPVAVPAYPAYIPMWERRAGGTDGCLFSPHFVYIVYHKIWRLSKMESGRKWKGWKNLEGAGLREMDTREGVCGKEWKGGQVGAT